MPDDSRARHSSDFRQSWLDEDTLAQVRALNDIAAARGQSLAQMALAWLLRDERVSSVVIGASSVKQLTNSLGALKNLYFTAEELAAIDAHGARPGHELWSD